MYLLSDYVFVTGSRLSIMPDKVWASSADSAELSMGMFVITTSSTTLAKASEQESNFSSALVNKC
jgi:hypothetical protein